MEANVTPVGIATLTGVVTSSSAPLPSWPSELIPQQYPAPLVVVAHVKPSPAATLVKVTPSGRETSTGLVVEPWLSSPNAPLLPLPQQYASPPVVTAHV